MEAVRVMKRPTDTDNKSNTFQPIEYILEELQTHIQLGTADTTGKVLILQSLVGVIKSLSLDQTRAELSQAVDELLNTVTLLDQATVDLIAGAEAQVAELAEELESGGHETSAIQIADIDSELERRREMRERIARIQEDLENQQDETRERLSTITQLLTHGASENEKKDKEEKRKFEIRLEAYEKTIASVIDAIATNDREVELLTSHRNARILVNEGLPADIIGKKIEIDK
jgi:hypothetical protein